MEQETFAVVGSACRFAGGIDSPSKLWKILKDPQDLSQEIPKERFNAEGFYHPDHSYHGHGNVKKSYMISHDPACFDAEFFNINPIEAKSMDPQQRLLLEVVYEAVESAGMTIEGMSGSDTCVFAGSMTADYDAIVFRDIDRLPTYAAVGTSRAILSNRLSHSFNWKGASVTIDTACSSSLIALHSAIQTLRSGDSETAIVCGSNLILGPEPYIIESNVKMLSPDGLSRMWDKGANGYARGEGLAALVIKPLSAALKANDHIECVIRGTGMNQDGHTPGLTMPSPDSQRELIHKTYAKVGLDLSLPQDRPQFFEAHGTGTPAGDPVEAEAIYSAFVASKEACLTGSGDHPLYVGSIKTVLGHTEGTAGLAGVLKAMLAIQNSFIPPNLHFDQLNPAVKPFYKHLEILRTGISWPKLAPGQVRRASVNSFGFGGSNAHAIIEAYSNETLSGSAEADVDDTVFGPYTFSAASELALRANIAAYVEYLSDDGDYKLRDLAYTLRERRSLMQYRLAVPAAPLPLLRQSLVDCLSGTDSGSARIVRPISKIGSESAKVLGVFTGQGAQYASMGAELIRASSFPRSIIKRLETYLSELPEQDKPDWSLEAELLADSATSRIGESSISQPLSTAIQIMLVDLLDAAGVHFDIVIGHSSGEIAAAYAAKFISARDAMYISYYRGLCCEYSKSPNGEIPGAMLAVGTTLEDAMALCNDETFAGRIHLAAVNSSSSVTISGDVDAIEELATVMEDEKKFQRRLRVDRAYHSAHMQACTKPYADGMERAGVSVQKHSQTPQARSCRWYSSVYGGRLMDDSFDLCGAYWLENLVKPVMFEAATSAALQSLTTFDAVLEVGPHPALKGPVAQTMQEVLPKPVAYSGTLQRGGDAMASFSESLGFLWSHLDRRSIDLDRFERAMVGEKKAAFKLLKGLPHYQWTHNTQYWSESRRSRQLRTRNRAVHPLLGHLTPESGSHALRWKHILKPSEMPWLRGHAVQNQIIFPAAGYISSATEAAQYLATGDQEMQLLDFGQFVIHQAIPFQSEEDGIEVLIEITQITRSQDGRVVSANFSYSAALGGPTGTTDLSLAATCTMQIRYGEPNPSLLPERQPEPPHMIDIRPQRLYDYLSKLEYNFSGSFRSLVQLRRKLGFSRCVGALADRDSDCRELLIHPADLDAAFQAVNLAVSYPGDEEIRHLHLPTTISNIRINVAALGRSNGTGNSSSDAHFHVDSEWNRPDPMIPTTGFSGNASLYFGDRELQHAGVQAEGIVMKPVGDSNDERKIYYGLEYVPTKLDGVAAAENIAITDEVQNLMLTLRRIMCFYAVQLDRDVPADSPARTNDGVLKHHLNFCHHLVNELKKGRAGSPEWLQDTKQDIMDAVHRLGPELENTADVKLHLLVGETMPRVFRGEADMLEELRLSGLLTDFYRYGAGLRQATEWLAALIKQLTDRSPRLRLMEVGAGTGSATKEILATIGRNFQDYTFTDISMSFSTTPMEGFATWKDRMTFKTCNVEVDPVEQDFVEGEYDVVIASQTLHATSNLRQTLCNMRRLLKPGGWLLLGECSPDGKLSDAGSFIFGTLPGWWNGVQDGRELTAFASVSVWDETLRQSGFGGVEVVNPDHIVEAFGITAMAARAVDDRISMLQTPLSSPTNLEVDRIIIVGGQTEPVAIVVQQLQRIFADMGAATLSYKTLEELRDHADFSNAAILCLADVEQPVFQDMTTSRWEVFRKLFVGDHSMLWVTCGRTKGEVYSNMTLGFGRSALNEEADLRVQFLDLADISQLDADALAKAFVVFTNRSLLDASRKTQILHTPEREIVIDDEGRELVPRLAHQFVLNDRLSSTRRVVEHETDLRSREVALEQNGSGIFLRQLSRFDKAAMIGPDPGHDVVELRISHSLLSAIRTPWGPRSLVLASDTDGKKHLALTTHLPSILRVAACHTLQLEEVAHDDLSLVSDVATRLVVMSIFENIGVGERVLVHNASSSLAAVISAEAQDRNVRVAFTSESQLKVQKSPADAASWVSLQPHATASDIARAVDSNVACFVDFSREPGTLSSTLAALTPPFCRKETWKTLCPPRSAASCSEVVFSSLKQYLTTAWKRTAKHVDLSVSRIDLEHLVASEEKQKNPDPLTVVDWTKASIVPARVCRLDVSPMFKPNSTYWLCGLSGPLGTSICDWMISRGVRHMVISSRNPKMDQRWVEGHRFNGATIKIMSCDVTDEAALRSVHQTIVQELPPIAGVVSAAMVLRDVAVRNMTYDQLQDVIRPKLLGSIYLDRIFHDVNLDFFTVLSSTNAIIGNPGQANYAAANMGMAGVATQRRQRGLRASTAHVGAIIGVGYVTNSIERLDQTVTMTNMIRVSEQEVHQMIAEVFEAAFQDSDVHPELVMGLKEVSREDPGQSKWIHDPKFERLVLPAAISSGRKGVSSASEESVRERLETCKTEQEVFEALKTAFTAKMRKVLFIKLSDDDIMDSTSSALGLDSLIAVDIRSWILKTFEVSIPVLRIMSADARISDIVAATLQELPAHMTPARHTPERGDSAQDSSSASDKITDENDTSSTSPATSVSTPQDSLSVPDLKPLAYNWDEEALLPEDIVPHPDISAPRKAPEVILLTGATGLLGHHLLATLLANPSVRKVICIAIRRLSDRLAANDPHLPTDPRIEYHEGDLSTPNFSLNEPQLTQIFTQVHAVIHNGADTSHMKPYNAVRDANVSSTRTLIHLCTTHGIPMHYISSAGIAMASSTHPFPSIPVDGTASTLDQISHHGARGYMCSKWICERMLETAHKNFSLPVHIHRPSTIIREGFDAMTERAGFDWVNSFLQYAHVLKSVPRILHNRGQFDLVYVRTCCEDVVKGVFHDDDEGMTKEKGVVYQNNVGDLVVPMQSLDQLALRKGGEEPYGVCSWDEWIRKAIEKGLHPAVAALIETMDEEGGVSYPAIVR